MKMPNEYIVKTEDGYPKTIEETCNKFLNDGYNLVGIIPCKDNVHMSLIFTRTSDNLSTEYTVWEVVNIPNNIENLCNNELEDNNVFITSFPSSSPGCINLVFAQY